MLMDEEPTGLRLNLGCGPNHLPGYENWDLKTGQPAYPLRLPDACCAEIRASHLLEHFSHREVIEVLTEWVRCLAPGGVLKIAVPSWEWCVENRKDPRLHLYVMGGHVDENDYHKCIFDEETLRGALEAVGLVGIEPWVSEGADCSALPVSLNLQGAKPGTPDETPAIPLPEPVELELDCDSIRAVLSAPRLGFLDMSFTATKALQPLGISIERLGGVFWHQSMTNLFEAHAAAGVKYLLTMDYDSLFTTAEVVELFRLLETRPEIDAACALQMRREKDSPLFHTGRARGADEGDHIAIPLSELHSEAIPIYTGHFGLTLLRAEKLAAVERPWFLGVPDEQGSWGEGRTDADIEFWRKWAAAGNTLYLANRCVIGHLELMITWPDHRLRAIHQHVGEYNQGGHQKPLGVWR